MDSARRKAVETKKMLESGLTVRFGADLRPDGELVYVILQKGDIELALTPKQADSLAKQIRERISPSGI